MNTITGTSELLEKVCSVIGADAFGAGMLSVFPKVLRGRRKMLDKTAVVSIKAVVSCTGGGREEILSVLDAAAQKAAAYSSGDGVLKISPVSPAVIAAHYDSGDMRFEQEYEIIYTEGSA